MAHYAYIYFRNALSDDNSSAGCKLGRVEIVVPTGACGNITGKKKYFLYLEFERQTIYMIKSCGTK